MSWNCASTPHIGPATRVDPNRRRRPLTEKALSGVRPAVKMRLVLAAPKQAQPTQGTGRGIANLLVLRRTRGRPATYSQHPIRLWIRAITPRARRRRWRAGVLCLAVAPACSRTERTPPRPHPPPHAPHHPRCRPRSRGRAQVRTCACAGGRPIARSASRRRAISRADAYSLRLDDAEPRQTSPSPTSARTRRDRRSRPTATRSRLSSSGKLGRDKARRIRRAAYYDLGTLERGASSDRIRRQPQGQRRPLDLPAVASEPGCAQPCSPAAGSAPREARSVASTPRWPVRPPSRGGAHRGGRPADAAFEAGSSSASTRTRRTTGGRGFVRRHAGRVVRVAEANPGEADGVTPPRTAAATSSTSTPAPAASASTRLGAWTEGVTDRPREGRRADLRPQGVDEESLSQFPVDSGARHPASRHVLRGDAQPTWPIRPSATESANASDRHLERHHVTRFRR